jgi:hypothetical protein
MPFSDQCNTRTVSYDLIQLSYIFQKLEFKDEVKSDLMVNAHKFEELFNNITEDGESIDGNVDKMNELLTDIFEKYTKVELDRTIQCEYCKFNLFTYTFTWN